MLLLGNVRCWRTFRTCCGSLPMSAAWGLNRPKPAAPEGHLLTLNGLRISYREVERNGPQPGGELRPFLLGSAIRRRSATAIPSNLPTVSSDHLVSRLNLGTRRADE